MPRKLNKLEKQLLEWKKKGIEVEIKFGAIPEPEPTKKSRRKKATV